MRHTPSFNKFLTDVVNLPQSRIDELKTNVDAVYDALDNSDVLDPHVVDKIPQGSWPHRTIIRPVDNLEFDADFLLQMAEDDQWVASPATYLDKLEEALRAHGVYGDMVADETKSRCVRVIYADEHHVDIVPYVILGGTRKVIVNRDINDWEDTDPEEFTRWMQTHDDIANGNMRRVIRLIKYLRDFHDAFPDVPSIIITKLVGDTITEAKHLNGHYSDVPTTLQRVMQDLDNYLQDHEEKPSIEDPSGAAAPDGTRVTFDHRWSDATYRAFRINVHHYRGLIDAAYYNTDEDDSLAEWQRIFGEDFKPAPGANASKSPLAPAPAAVPASTRSSRGA